MNTIVKDCSLLYQSIKNAANYNYTTVKEFKEFVVRVLPNTNKYVRNNIKLIADFISFFDENKILIVTTNELGELIVGYNTSNSSDYKSIVIHFESVVNIYFENYIENINTVKEITKSGINYKKLISDCYTDLLKLV